MRKQVWIVLIIVVTIIAFARWEIFPVGKLLDWKSAVNATGKQDLDPLIYEVFDRSDSEEPFITVDFLRGEHFWHPQIALWLEDTSGNHIKTLFVTNSTAKGRFYGGRSVDNYRDFDIGKQTENQDIRRVNALPHWAYRRGVRAKDGLMIPHPDDPLPDAISGATPTGNFYFNATGPDGIDSLSAIIVKLEINVAFDQNEYYSEYDYLEDTAYHSGTGLLGQPSLIYSARISPAGPQKYYLMDLIGHGHHSGGDGHVYTDLSGVTTALRIAERILVKVHF